MILKELQQSPELTIAEVATSEEHRKSLRDAQLEFLRKYVTRDSIKWEEY